MKRLLVSLGALIFGSAAVTSTGASASVPADAGDSIEAYTRAALDQPEFAEAAVAKILEERAETSKVAMVAPSKGDPASESGHSGAFRSLNII